MNEISQTEKERRAWAEGRQHGLTWTADPDDDLAVVELDAEAEVQMETIQPGDPNIETATSYAIELAYAAGYVSGLATLRERIG